MENFLGCRTREALAHVKQVGDHEDGEDCRLGSNQAVHSESPTRGGSPLDFGFEHRNWRCTHLNCLYSYFQSGSSGCLRSQSGRRLLTVGIKAKLYAGGGELVAHSRVHASHGSLPAILPLIKDKSRLTAKTRMPSPWKKTPMVTIKFHVSHPRPGS